MNLKFVWATVCWSLMADIGSLGATERTCSLFHWFLDHHEVYVHILALKLLPECLVESTLSSPESLLKSGVSSIIWWKSSRSEAIFKCSRKHVKEIIAKNILKDGDKPIKSESCESLLSDILKREDDYIEMSLIVEKVWLTVKWFLYKSIWFFFLALRQFLFRLSVVNLM